jgi:hypothetical protein
MPDNYFGSISFVDKANKPATVRYNVDAADAITEVTTPGTGAIADLNATISPLSLLTVVKTSGGVASKAASPTLPTDDQAYRSSKLTVFFHDTTTGKKETNTIPGRDPAHYNTLPGTPNVILTVAAGGTSQIEDFVTAWNATVRSSNSPHNNVTVDQIKVSGRRQG